MGVGGIGIWKLLILLIIIMMVFGTKKLSTLGADLGGALKGFKDAMEAGNKDKSPDPAADSQAHTIAATAEKVDEKI